jgi:hypothetical protein
MDGERVAVQSGAGESGRLSPDTRPKRRSLLALIDALLAEVPLSLRLSASSVGALGITLKFRPGCALPRTHA